METTQQTAVLDGRMANAMSELALAESMVRLLKSEYRDSENVLIFHRLHTMLGDIANEIDLIWLEVPKE